MICIELNNEDNLVRTVLELALGLERVWQFGWCFHHEIVAATEARNHPQECILRKRTTFFHNPNWIVPKVFSSDALTA